MVRTQEVIHKTGFEEIVSNLLEADFLGTWDPFDDHSTLADFPVLISSWREISE
jgi:hypothetical protein